MSGSNAEGLVLRPSKWKMAGFLVLCAGFTAIAALMVRDGRAMGWFVGLFFGLGVVVFAAMLLPGAAYLKIDREGFQFCSLYRASPKIAWREVSAFRVAAVPPAGNRLVVFDWHRPGVKRTMRELNRSLVGASDGLPDSYGMKPQALADLLNQWRMGTGGAGN